MDDWQLLRQYLDEGSEAAFGRLVDRHLKMVYYACRRDLGNDQLAEDATQAVFLNLAHHAPSLKPGASIAGWLFTTARYAARNVHRSEANRRHYEEEAAQAMYESTAGTPGWDSVEPWLNDGLSQLSAGDRELLLLRYFEGASLSDVARAVGIAEPAARKRVSRAVDRLRQYLARKEATVTSAILLAWLTEHSAKAAPAHLASSITQSAGSVSFSSPPLLGAGGLPGGSTLNPLLGKGLIIVSTSKIVAAGVAAVVLLLGISFYAYHRVHSIPANVVSLAAPSSNASIQQAQQQVQVVLADYSSAIGSGNAQEAQALFSPDYVEFHNGKQTDTYSSMMRACSSYAQQRLNVQVTILSCVVSGNTATVKLDIRYTTGAHSMGGQATLTLVNSGGRWQITRTDA